MAIKNQSLTINIYAYDTGNNIGKTGDSGNFTLRRIIDGGAATALNNIGSISEPDSTNMKGIYEIPLDAEELNGDFICIHGVSATSDVVISPLFIQTERGNLATVDTVVDAIKAVTDNLPNSGALTDIDTGVNNIEAKLPTNEIMGSSDKADNDTVIDAILTNTAEIGTAGAGLTDLGGMSTGMKAEVNAEAKDVIFTDTISELSQGVPTATPTVATSLMLPYMALRNSVAGTETLLSIRNDAGTTITKGTLSDDGTTFTKAELVSGA